MLFRKKIEASCAYCRFGAKLEDDKILCAKKGLKTIDDVPEQHREEVQKLLEEQ